MTEVPWCGQRFKRVPRPVPFSPLELDPVLNERLEQWPHLKELIHCYRSDWLKDEAKYGHYESVPLPLFHNQVFECPDTDLEAELQLANVRQTRAGELSDDEPSTSGRQLGHSSLPEATQNKALRKHLGAAPLPCYEPIFDWDTERSTISGQRTQEAPSALSSSGSSLSVKIVSFSIQAGFVEPFYGTICLYHTERREKLSEDFHFGFFPNEFQEAATSSQRRGIFHIDSSSPSICMLIQLEKHATEEDGGTASVYSRKEPVHLTEREKQKLKVWAQMMPYREPFAWAAVPLFDNSIPGGVGGFGSPSSPLPSALGGTNIVDPTVEMNGRGLMEGKIAQDPGGTRVIVEIPGLNRVKENYIQESLQQPKAPVVNGRVLKWCVIEQKWTSHGIEECFYNKNYVRERPYGPLAEAPQPPPLRYQFGLNVNAVAGADRSQPVLDQQPPLPHENRAMIIYAQPYEASQPMSNVPIITYYEEPSEPYIKEPEQPMYADEPYQPWGVNEGMAPASYVAQPSRDQYHNHPEINIWWMKER
ncbi:hypothetical protein L7F22_064469 [Adiantum nelumboides]|nr:hypothetical protein [Adiantum nelumboides]